MSVDHFLARHRRIAYATITAVLVPVLAVATRCVYRLVADPAVLAVWWIGIATLSIRVYAFLRGRRADPGPPAIGRIVAIVPAYEQDPGDLHACVWSILNQRGVVVEEVHIVDNGSTGRPVQPFPHPRVRWHRTGNGGRQAAATYVLDRLDPDDWDFVLIAGGDCLLDPRSLDRQLRAFARPRVTATIGTVIVRNSGANLLTRLADLNVSSFVVPGAPVLYRAHIPFRYRHHDNRRLTTYAAGEGTVARVSRAVSSTTSPTDLRALGRQRLDWATSWWHVAPSALTGAGRRRAAARRLPALVHLVIAPLTIGYAVVSLALSPRWPVVALYASLYLLVRYAATVRYAAGRRRKRWVWLLLGPAEAFGNLVFLIPIKYLALIRLCVRGRHVASPAASMAARGTVYYAGYLPDGHGS